jgi:REP element-mobilizing transposase RayT
MSQLRHKNIRLNPGNYTGLLWYFLTLCTYRRAPYFRNNKIARWLLATLHQESACHSFLPRAYCLMPDHLHLLLQATEPNNDLLRFVATELSPVP